MHIEELVGQASNLLKGSWKRNIRGGVGIQAETCSLYARLPCVSCVGSSGSVVRTSDSCLKRTEKRRFQSSCCCFKTWAIPFNPHCSSSLVCINVNLAINSGGHKKVKTMNSLRIVISAWLNAFQSCYCWNEQVCQG